jgi:hypothetical protein
MERRTGNKRDGDKDKGGLGSVDGVIKIEEHGGLAREFITIGRSFEEALGRCTIRDDEQRNAIIIYKAQLELFDMWDEIDDLTNWLNASAAVGGYNRSLASMTETRIYVPEGAGIKMDKNTHKALMELQKQRERGKQPNEEGETYKE